MCIRALLSVALLARVAAAQSVETAARPIPGVVVSGVVFDSIARAPLAGAAVQIVDADSLDRFGRMTVSDSLGRFTIADVPAGRYMLGFLHPMLDSLGLEPSLRVVNIDGRRPVRTQLAIPSPARLRAAICGPRAPSDSGAFVIGVVRDARGRAPLPGVTVSGEWVEYSFTSDTFIRRVPQIVATTAQNGWFAICDLPRAGTIAIRGSRGSDSTHRIELDVPADRFLRRELYLGSSTEGRLSGVVVAAAGGSALAGARVSIGDGPHAITNDRGEWTLTDAPAGSRMVEIRAVGYHTELEAVDVIVGAAPLRSALSTMRAVLDTMRITATRMIDVNMRGFDDRRRSAAGRYLTSEYVALRDPIVTSDLFKTVPGLTVESTFDGTLLLMRSTIQQNCSPAVYIEGRYMGPLSADELDDWVSPAEIAGIEIYSGPGVPPQFSPGALNMGRSDQGCGSIVIWTKPLPPSSSRLSWRRRVAAAFALIAVVSGVRALFD